MTKAIGRFGDMMLGALLRKGEAGACVAEHGQYCGICLAVDGYCGSDGHWYWRYRKAYYDCYGVCKSSTSRAVCYTSRSGALC